MTTASRRVAMLLRSWGDLAKGASAEEYSPGRLAYAMASISRKSAKGSGELTGNA